MSLTLKIVGAVLIMLGGGLVGKRLRSNAKKQLDFFDAMRHSIIYLQGCITVENRLLGISLHDTGKEYFTGSEKNIYEYIAESIEDSSKRIEEAVGSGIKEFINKNSYINETNLSAIYDIPSALALSDNDDKKDRLMYIADKLETVYDRLKTKFDKESSMYIKLALLASGIIVILLI